MIESMAENNSNLNKWAKWENPEDGDSAADTEENVDNVSENVETDNTVESFPMPLHLTQTDSFRIILLCQSCSC